MTMAILNINRTFTGNIKENVKKTSIKERFLNYLAENQYMIFGGLAVMVGNPYALKYYSKLKNER